MLAREQNIVEEAAERLSRNGRVLRIVAFGSRVRGDFRADSDLDLLIIVDKKDRVIKDFIVGLIYDYELDTDISFSPTVLSLHELEVNRQMGSPFLKSVEAEGIVLYDAERGGKKGALKLSA